MFSTLIFAAIGATCAANEFVQPVCKHLYDFNVRFEGVENFIKEFNVDIHILVFACVAALARKLIF